MWRKLSECHTNLTRVVYDGRVPLNLDVHVISGAVEHVTSELRCTCVSPLFLWGGDQTWLPWVPLPPGLPPGCRPGVWSHLKALWGRIHVQGHHVAVMEVGSSPTAGSRPSVPPRVGLAHNVAADFSQSSEGQSQREGRRGRQEGSDTPSLWLCSSFRSELQVYVTVKGRT